MFEIESWARSGDRVSHLLYNKLLLAKEIQLNLWTETCLGVARNSGGRLQGGSGCTRGGWTTHWLAGRGPGDAPAAGLAGRCRG